MSTLLLVLVCWPLVSFPIAWLVGLVFDFNDDGDDW